jgi:ADP-heptose:LPS heptosyltransferase
VGRHSYRFRFLYTDLAGPPEVLFRDPKAIHTVHNQAALVAALNLPVADFSLHLSVGEKARERLHGRLAALDLPPEGYVVLQPTASWPSKQWPQERFLEAARLLTASTGRRVVVSLPEKSPIARALAPVDRFPRRHKLGNSRS